MGYYFCTKGRACAQTPCHANEMFARSAGHIMDVRLEHTTHCLLTQLLWLLNQKNDEIQSGQIENTSRKRCLLLCRTQGTSPDVCNNDRPQKNQSEASNLEEAVG